MSRSCPLTGKHTVTGNMRSHSLRSTRRTWKVNLQKAKIMVNGKLTSVRISTNALRTLRKGNKNNKPVAAEVKAAAPIEAVKAEEAKAVAVEAKPAEKIAVAKNEEKKVAAPKKAAAPKVKKAVKAEEKTKAAK